MQDFTKRANGQLDPEFGTAGLVRMQGIGELQERAFISALAPLPEGAVLVASTAIDFHNFYIARLTDDGAPDPGFRGEGAWRDDFGENAIVRLIHPLEGGGFLVAAQSLKGIALARYHASGEPDMSFNNGNKMILPISDLSRLKAFSGGEALAMAPLHSRGIPDSDLAGVQCVADGDRVYYAMDTFYGEYERLVVVICLTSEGVLAPDFGTDGYIIITLNGAIGPWSGFEAIALQAHEGGKLPVILGLVPEYDLGPRQGFVLRCQYDGSPDPLFGHAQQPQNPGVVLMPQAMRFSWALAASPSGSISVGGEAAAGAVAVCLDNSGGFDEVFNQGQPLLSLPPSAWTSATYVDGQVERSLMLAGTTRVSNGYNIALRRVAADGVVDPEFGDQGLLQLPYSFRPAGIADIYMDSRRRGSTYVAAEVELYRLLV